MANLGLFGGRFDPVHHGHLAAARAALSSFALDRVIFIPSGEPPGGRAMNAAPEDRLEMLRRALEAEPRFLVSDLELRRPGKAYTVDTVALLRREHPADRLFWILGGDHVARLAHWRAIDRLKEMVEFVAIDRPGHPLPARSEVPGLIVHRCEMPPVPVSSSDIRARVRDRMALHDFAPAPVVDVIRQRGLYMRPNTAAVHREGR